MARTVVFFGGNSGIGWEAARRQRALGNRVVAVVRDPGGLAELGVEVIPAGGLGEPGVFPEVVDGMAYFPGSINLKPFARLSDEDFLEDFRVNCLGAAAAVRALLPAMKAAESASVVLFSTVAVAQGMAFHASVAAAKGAVEGMARSLAAELAPKIRVNVIAPSLTDTPLAGNLLNSEAKREAASRRHPLQRVGDAGDVADLVGFLLSDASRFMTGQVLRPDGGLSSVRTF
jgi:3-oxoacyl-[acyl-carrier protein] reductase